MKYVYILESYGLIDGSEVEYNVTERVTLTENKAIELAKTFVEDKINAALWSEEEDPEVTNLELLERYITKPSGFCYMTEYDVCNRPYEHYVIIIKKEVTE